MVKSRRSNKIVYEFVLINLFVYLLCSNLFSLSVLHAYALIRFCFWFSIKLERNCHSSNSCLFILLFDFIFCIYFCLFARWSLFLCWRILCFVLTWFLLLCFCFAFILSFLLCTYFFCTCSTLSHDSCYYAWIALQIVAFVINYASQT